MHIEEITHAKGALCAEILKTLPQWFGMPASNAAYERDVEAMPMFGAVEDGTAVGFLALKRQTPHAFEIHVMGVKPAHHRHGAGRALVEAAAAFARGQGTRFLIVKTLSSRDCDPGYASTRAFYTAMEFLEIEELPEAWSPGNPLVLMLRRLA